MRKTSLLLTLLALSAALTACGRNGVTNTMLPQSSYTASSNSYLATTPTVRTNGVAQASAGGRAVATPTGYVYEQNAVTNAAGYNFYNAQNPCLYPRPGQTVNCGTNTGAAAGYYTGQQPTTATGVAGMPSSYGSGYAMPAGTPTAPAGYGAAQSSYGAPSSYGSAPAASNPYGTATTNPYGTAPAASSYGSTAPSSYGTPAATNPYGTAPAATNPYGTGTTAPSTYTGQSAPQTSSADRARSRIDTSSSSSTPTGSTGKKGVSF